jgi:glutaredoxin-like protein
MTESLIIMYGTDWCGDCVRSRKVFATNNIPYQWIDIDKDKTAKQIVRNINNGNSSVPTIIFPDGTTLVEPSDDELLKQLFR